MTSTGKTVADSGADPPPSGRVVGTVECTNPPPAGPPFPAGWSAPATTVECTSPSPVGWVVSTGGPAIVVPSLGVPPETEPDAAPFPVVSGPDAVPFPPAPVSGVVPFPPAPVTGVAPFPPAPGPGVVPFPPAPVSGVAPFPPAPGPGVVPFPPAPVSGVAPFFPAPVSGVAPFFPAPGADVAPFTVGSPPPVDMVSTLTPRPTSHLFNTDAKLNSSAGGRRPRTWGRPWRSSRTRTPAGRGPGTPPWSSTGRASWRCGRCTRCAPGRACCP